MLKNMKNHNTIGYKANCQNITYIHSSYQQKTEDFSINYANLAMFKLVIL